MGEMQENTTTMTWTWTLVKCDQKKQQTDRYVHVPILLRRNVCYRIHQDGAKKAFPVLGCFALSDFFL